MTCETLSMLLILSALCNLLAFIAVSRTQKKLRAERVLAWAVLHAARAVLDTHQRSRRVHGPLPVFASAMNVAINTLAASLSRLDTMRGAPADSPIAHRPANRQFYTKPGDLTHVH